MEKLWKSVTSVMVVQTFDEVQMLIKHSFCLLIYK